MKKEERAEIKKEDKKGNEEGSQEKRINKSGWKMKKEQRFGIKS